MITDNRIRPALRVLSGGGPPPTGISTNISENSHIIMSGNLSEGYVAWGPFDSFEMATQYVFQHLDEIETWIMVLFPALKSRPS